MKRASDDIIQIITRLSRVEPPQGFTRDIMERINADAIPVASGMRVSWYRTIYAELVRPGGIFDIGSHRECSLCFFMTGIFYFITGIILFMGFRTGVPGEPAVAWMARQPEFLLISASLLILFGLIMLMEGKLPVAIAKKGVFLFIGFAVFNAVMTREVLWWHTLPTILVFIITFISIIMGIMFAVALDKYQRCMDLG